MVMLDTVWERMVMVLLWVDKVQENMREHAVSKTRGDRAQQWLRTMQGNVAITRAARKWSLAAVWRNEDVVNGGHNLIIELGGLG
jgi:hypothetical protein